MAKTATKPKEMAESKLDGSKYSCQVILEKCTLEQANDRSMPTDARLIRYKVDGKDFLDVTRSAKAANIFDLYFDTYGCLLYTSPSPRDATLSRMPSSA